MTDKRKQSLYFPGPMMEEIQAEARRQDRPISWIVQQAWRIGRAEIARYPSVDDVLAGITRDHAASPPWRSTFTPAPVAGSEE